MISGKTAVYGIFGWPVEHTFSPGMHNAAFAKLGMDACYVPFPVHPENLEDAVRAVRALGVRGVNVTVPHKERVVAFLDELAEDARLIGAVNTIEVREKRLIGHNTDGRGFVRSLRDDAGLNPRGKRFLILGAGGAGRAIGFSLALAGAAQISFRDVDTVKTETLARTLREKTGVQAEVVSEQGLAEASGEADSVVNATPLGLKKSDPLPIPKAYIRKQHLVCDIVYNPAETKLLRSAHERGARTLRGIGMLLYQGVIAFEIWTGKHAPVSVMKNTLTRQIRNRSRS